MYWFSLSTTRYSQLGALVSEILKNSWNSNIRFHCCDLKATESLTFDQLIKPFRLSADTPFCLIGRKHLDALKLEECKTYLRKHELRISGTKATCIKRILEHWRSVIYAAHRIWLIYIFVNHSCKFFAWGKWFSCSKSCWQTICLFFIGYKFQESCSQKIDH